MLRVAEALRDHMKALLRANQIAWKQGPDQAARELERCVTKLGFKVVLSIISRRTFGPPQAATSMPRRSTAILTMGADRMCEDYAEGREFIDTVPISESDRRKIVYGNAKALYKLWMGA